MPNVRGRRKAGASAVSKTVKKTTQVTKDQDIRKSLSVLQPTADDPASLAHGGEKLTRGKTKKLKPTLGAQENSPMKPKRSKRKTAASRAEELKVKSSTPVSNDSKNCNLKQQTLVEYSEKLNIKLKVDNFLSPKENYKEIPEENKASLSNISIPSESSGYFSDGTEKHECSIKSDVSTGNKLTVESTNAGTNLPEADDGVLSCERLQSTPPISQDVYDMLVSDKVSASYWKDLAEQRRLALEEALRENELLHDQVEVMETENARLRSLVDDAEKLAETIKDILGDA